MLGLVVPRAGPTTEASFMLALFSSHTPCEGSTGFVHLLTAVEYCKYVYKSFGGFQRDSKGFVSQNRASRVASFFRFVCAMVAWQLPY